MERRRVRAREQVEPIAGREAHLQRAQAVVVLDGRQPARLLLEVLVPPVPLADRAVLGLRVGTPGQPPGWCAVPGRHLQAPLLPPPLLEVPVRVAVGRAVEVTAVRQDLDLQADRRAALETVGDRRRVPAGYGHHALDQPPETDAVLPGRHRPGLEFGQVPETLRGDRTRLPDARPELVDLASDVHHLVQTREQDLALPRRREGGDQESMVAAGVRATHRTAGVAAQSVRAQPLPLVKASPFFAPCSF